MLRVLIILLLLSQAAQAQHPCCDGQAGNDTDRHATMQHDTAPCHGGDGTTDPADQGDDTSVSNAPCPCPASGSSLLVTMTESGVHAEHRPPRQRADRGLASGIPKQLLRPPNIHAS